MRLFVAVEIDDEARRIAAAAAKALEVAIGKAMRARWVPPENMHLTVRFIGHVDDARVPAVLGALAPRLEIPAFDIELGGSGAFPPSGPPRAIWIGVRRGLQPLASMHEELSRRLGPLGFEPETRAFTAHLTLARIKHAPSAARQAIRAALERVTIPSASFRVSRGTIFESQLSPKGPRYEPVAFIPCQQ